MGWADATIAFAPDVACIECMVFYASLHYVQASLPARVASCLLSVNLVPCLVTPQLIVTLGMFAVALHNLAGMGLMHSRTAAGKLAIEVCTPQSMAVQDTTTTDSLPSDSHVMRECCKLCIASGSLPLAVIVAAVVPAPTFTVSLPAFAAARPATFDWTAYFPRGPAGRA